MKEAYLTAPKFTRHKPLSAAELLLLAEAQEPANKARYTYHDCQTHGLFKVDNELGLAEIDCPRRGKCVVQEVFDPKGYAEHYELVPEPAAPEPAPVATEPTRAGSPEQLSQQLAELPAAGLPPAELKRRLERILGCQISAEPAQLLEALQEGLACADAHKTQRDVGDEEPEDEPPSAGAMPDMTDVEHYASLMFDAREVCLVLGLDYQVEQRRPEFQQQMLRGRLLQESKVRDTIFLHARLGSAPAQTEALKIIGREAVARAGRHE